MNEKPKWAPRVQPRKIQRLYESDGEGMLDEELLDEVGYGLYSRCRSILTVTDAAMGRAVRCWNCDAVCEVGQGGSDALICCPGCGWTSDWATFHKSWRHQELCAEGLTDMIYEYLSSWERARMPRERMLAVDRLIHRWHWETGRKPGEPEAIGRPSGVNLIEGSRKQVLEFLDGLSAGPSGQRKSWEAQRERIRRGNR